jgi:hypothetical protein
MKTLSAIVVKILLAGTILTLGLMSFPVLGARAAGLNDPTASSTATPAASTRLQAAWSRVQKVYQAEGEMLTRASSLVTKAQAWIAKVSAKGWDTSVVQAALTALQSALQTAQPIHDGGASIISAHAGFDASGTVVDPVQAKATILALRQVNQNTRTAMNGTGKALRAAIKALRQAHQPATPATATPSASGS